jgi:hypothetical protein
MAKVVMGSSVRSQRMRGRRRQDSEPTLKGFRSPLGAPGFPAKDGCLDSELTRKQIRRDDHVQEQGKGQSYFQEHANRSQDPGQQ